MKYPWQNKNNTPSIWEWIAAGVGSLLFLLSFFFMIYEGLTGNSKPPELVIKTNSVTAVSGGYLVQFSIENYGDEVTASITVTGELLDGSTSVEKNETTFDYIPSKSERKGGMFFVNNPKQYKLVLKPGGYQEP